MANVQFIRECPKGENVHLSTVTDILLALLNLMYFCIFMIVPYSSKKRPHFPAFKKKKHSTENILRKSDLTVGKLQMQVVDKGFYFGVSKASEGQA